MRRCTRCGNGPAPAVTGGAAVPQSDGCKGSERVGPRHQRGTAMEHYAGIDVSLERSSVCVVDATGRIVREDAVCRRLMTVPGVGALVAVTFTSAVDDPARFRRSRAVGAHFGLTPKRYQSGETDVTGGISKAGDAMVRTALYEAANVMLTRAGKFSTLKQWGLEVAKRRGMRRAKVALARKLSTVLHRLWADGSEFRFGQETAAA